MTLEGQYTIRLASGDEFGPASPALLQRWAAEGRVPLNAALVPNDGGPSVLVAEVPEIARFAAAPPVQRVGGAAPQLRADGSDPNYTGIIPYKNTPALIAYYCGLFSLLPLVGVVLAIVAMLLGVIGLRKRARNPAIKGAVHAWIGIIMGSLLFLFWGLVIVVMIASAMP